MSQPLQLFIDVQNRQLVRGTNTSLPASLPDVFQGDTLSLSLRFLQISADGLSYSDIDYSAASVIVAVGSIGLAPAAGYYTLTDSGASETTGTIAYNATASDVQTAIRSGLTSNWSDASVIGNAGGPYTITNGSDGAQTLLSGATVSLTPASFVRIDNQQTGTSDIPSIQYLQLLQNPVAVQDTWTASPAPTAVVTELQAGSGTQNEIQQITLGNAPYAGAFNVNFGGQTSAPIQWNASPAAVQTALQAMSSIGSGNCSVGGTAGAWVVTFTGSKGLASQSLMTTVATGLTGPTALVGSLGLNTTGIEEAIGEQGSISQVFAIQVTPSGGSPTTFLQTSITINNDLIVGAPAVPSAGVSYYTSGESDARYFQIANNLSEGTAGTIRTNLGLVIGTNVQAHSANLDTLAASNPFTAGSNITFSGSWPHITIAGSASGVTTLGSHFTPVASISGSTLNLTNAVNALSGLVAFDGGGALTSPSTTGLDITDSIGSQLHISNSGGFIVASADTMSAMEIVSGSTLIIAGTDTYNFPASVGTVTIATTANTPGSYHSGQFTLSSGVSVVSDTNITTSSVIICTVASVIGTRAGNPDIVPSSGVGFTATGGASDNSLYNYIVFN